MPRAISRRTFLTAAASAGAASLLKPGISLAAPVNDFRGPLPAASPFAWQDKSVIDLTNSPYAKLKPVPVSAVTIEEGFWSRRRATNVSASIPTMHDELLAHGRMDNFLRLDGKSNAPQQGPVYSDSDMYKWLEAVGFALQTQDHPELRQMAEVTIRQMVAAQEPGGYLNTYYVQDHANLRMLPKTQTTGHELYCIGHLLQGAIAYYPRHRRSHAARSWHALRR